MLIAALPPADPPARVVAGVHVTWPLPKSETVLAPGAKLVVRVSSARRRSTISLVRVNAQGKALRRVAKRTLRRGTFRATLPASAPARYALRLNVAGRSHRSWITVPPPTPAPVAVPAPSPTPAPTPAPLPFCQQPELPASAFKGELRLQATSVRAGAALAYTIANVGQGNLVVRSTRGLTDQPVTTTGPEHTPLAPGTSLAFTYDIPATLSPGTYQLRHDMYWGQCDYVVGFPLLSERFEVTSP